MNPVAKRTITGLTVGLGIIALFLYCPLRGILPIVLALSTLAQLEFYQMTRKYEPVTWFGLLIGGGFLLAAGLFGFSPDLFTLVFCFIPALLLAFLLLCLFVLFNARYKSPLGSIAITLLGFFYVPLLLAFFLLTTQFTGRGFWGADMWTSRAGLYTLLALVALAKFSDTGGFAFGMAFGKHKMCPTISPKKSWEGLAGSMVFAAVTAGIFLWVARRFNWADDIPAWGFLTYPRAIAFGAVTALVATASDLVESRFKREVGVKDSATFMPAGMGGFLDMLDSTLFIPALAYPLLIALG
ncbi:MAG: phosphatidate cytidylyltransferase [Kiritimatiellae bacterium]|nr:phosphatidate cytidylyltransferase [Kiritimatiellia bacterium]